MELRLGYSSLPAEQLRLCARLVEEALELRAREELRHDRDLAERLKRELDARTRAAWNVVVGSSFGCSATVEGCAAAFFRLGGLSFLLWRVPPALKPS